MSDSSLRMEHSVAIRVYAKAKGIDEVHAAKLFRSRLRSNFATIAKIDPKNYGSKGKIKRVANDRSPWGSHSRATLVKLFPEVVAYKRTTKPRAPKGGANVTATDANAS